MLCARIGTGNTYRVFCMVTVTESHMFRSLNESCPLQKRTTDVCKNGGTSVVQVSTQWHGHGRLLYIHVLGVAGTRLQ